MEPTRPLAKRRLEQAIERFLIGSAPERSAPAVANLRRVLALISQEKRFLLFLFLREQTRFLTDYEKGLWSPDVTQTLKSQAFEWMLGS
jgi:hypothetical protein